MPTSKNTAGAEAAAEATEETAEILVESRLVHQIMWGYIGNHRDTHLVIFHIAIENGDL